jgi:hypothetical protein
MPDRYRQLCRPDADATPGEITRYRREVTAALEAIGVGYGEEFVVVPAAEFNRQPSLEEDRLGPFARDSETSRQAALDAYPRQGSQRHRILLVFARQVPRETAAGYTRDELEAFTSLSGNTIRPRVQELIEGGFLTETEETRRTRSGSEATVLKITHKGRAEIQEKETVSV